MLLSSLWVIWQMMYSFYTILKLSSGSMSHPCAHFFSVIVLGPLLRHILLCSVQHYKLNDGLLELIEHISPSLS